MFINQTTLANGLRLVHAEVPDTQMVALCVLYHVGAINEDPDHTGWAHLLEHLMFEGTPRVTDYDTQVQLAGGENNAFTNNDITSFYVTVPRVNMEKLFFLESDRMSGISLDEQSVQVQKQVVIEEFKQRNLNQPYGDVQHLLRALAFRVHPYRWPTIGIEPSHIEKATPDDIRAFYHRYYHPSNAVLAVTGAISWEEAQSLADQYFGPLGNGELQLNGELNDNSQFPVEPPQDRMRRKHVRRDVPLDMLVMAWHMPSRFDADFSVCDAITDLLANGLSSRLNLHLVQQRPLFNSIDAYISGSADPGLIHVIGRLNPGVTLPDAEQAVWQEINQLKHESVGEYELNKVRNRFESERVFNNINYLNVAIALAQHVIYGTTPNEEIRRYRAVTPADIQRVARALLTKKNCTVLYYEKKEQ